MNPRAETALQPTHTDHGLLNRMKRVNVRHALHGRYFASRGGNGKHQAGRDGLAVNQHRACAAIAGGASLLGAGQSSRSLNTASSVLRGSRERS